MGIGIDWVAVVVLGAAWAFSLVRSVPQFIRHWVFALASSASLATGCTWA